MVSRLTFPDEGSRLVYRTAGDSLRTATGVVATVYVDAAATTLADIELPDGTPVTGSALTVDEYSRLPLFLGPDGVDSVYVVVSGGPAAPVYARADDRIDSVQATATDALDAADGAAVAAAGAQTAAETAQGTAETAAGVAAAALPAAQKGAPSGVASLDGSGQVAQNVPAGRIPDMGTTYGVAHHAANDAVRYVSTGGSDGNDGRSPGTAFATVQAGINALPTSGGVVHIAAGTWALAAPIVLKSNVTLAGAGENSTFLTVASTSQSAIVGVDLSHVSIRDLHITGPGDWLGTATGVDITLSGTQGNATFYVEVTNVFIEQFGVDGLAVQTPIVSTFRKVTVFRCGRHGIHLYSTGEAAGTSCTLDSCFPAGCHGAGYRIKQMAYMTLNGCAADANGTGYEYDTCVGLTENSSGTEEPYDFSSFQTGYAGYSRKVFNSKATLNAPYAIGNVGTAYWVTNGSFVTINSLFEGSPGNPDSPVNNPTNSLLVDAGCRVQLGPYSVVTPLNLAAGSTTMPAARMMQVVVTDPNGADLATGDGQAYVTIPAELNGANLVAAHASLTTAGSGTTTVQVRNVTQNADMLSTPITVDAGETSSYTAATQPVIDGGNDDVATGNIVRVDVDTAGAGAKGLTVLLTFRP
jgi:hypothetical protein